MAQRTDGSPQWRSKVNVSEWLGFDASDDLIACQVAKGVSDKFKASSTYRMAQAILDGSRREMSWMDESDADDLIEIIDEMSDFGSLPLDDKGADDRDYFDAMMGALYDWCDVEKRVWIES